MRRTGPGGRLMHRKSQFPFSDNHENLVTPTTKKRRDRNAQWQDSYVDCSFSSLSRSMDNEMHIKTNNRPTKIISRR